MIEHAYHIGLLVLGACFAIMGYKAKAWFQLKASHSVRIAVLEAKMDKLFKTPGA